MTYYILLYSKKYLFFEPIECQSKSIRGGVLFLIERQKIMNIQQQKMGQHVSCKKKKQRIIAQQQQAQHFLTFPSCAITS